MSNIRKILLITLMLTSFSVQAKTYFTPEQSLKMMFPSIPFTHNPVKLSSEQQKKMTDASSVKFPFDGSQVWKGTDNSWFIVDQVVGKHEFITYAIGINPNGEIKDIEILEYNESYGYQVKEKDWLKQFFGKTSANSFKLNQEIDNISGATLSCKHLSDGVKRVMVMYELALKGQK